MTETLLQIFFLGMMSRENENRDEKRENALKLQAIKGRFYLRSNIGENTSHYDGIFCIGRSLLETSEVYLLRFFIMGR